MSATLGIATIAYFPFCFFNLFNVLVSFAYALLGFQIKYLKPEEEVKEPPEEVTLYGIGGQRVDANEYELAVTKG